MSPQLKRTPAAPAATPAASKPAAAATPATSKPISSASPATPAALPLASPSADRWEAGLVDADFGVLWPALLRLGWTHSSGPLPFLRPALDKAASPRPAASGFASEVELRRFLKANPLPYPLPLGLKFLKSLTLTPYP